MTIRNYAQAKKVYIDSFVKSYKEQKISLNVLNKKDWEEFSRALSDNFDETIEDIRNFAFVYSGKDSQILGFRAARTEGNILYSAEGAVRADVQNQGISKDLLRACVEKVKAGKNQKIKVVVFTRIGNIHARRVWELLGFKEYPDVFCAIKAGIISETVVAKTSDENLSYVVPYYDPNKYVFLIWNGMKRDLLQRLTLKKFNAIQAQ